MAVFIAAGEKATPVSCCKFRVKRACAAINAAAHCLLPDTVAAVVVSLSSAQARPPGMLKKASAAMALAVRPQTS